MSKHAIEALLRSNIFKSQQDIQVYKRLWEKCELFPDRLGSKVCISNKYNITIGFYPTTDCIGFAAIGPNQNVIEASCFKSAFSIFSDSTHFTVDMTSKLRDHLYKYINNKEGIHLLFQRQPPILGINSERIKDVLLYSEFVGALQYECFQWNHTWPESIHLSDIAKGMRLKLYEVQGKGEERLKTYAAASNLDNNSVAATALSVAEFGSIFIKAKSILEEFGIIENPPDPVSQPIIDKETVVKSFIAGNARVLQNHDFVSVDSFLSKDYAVCCNYGMIL